MFCCGTRVHPLVACVILIKATSSPWHFQNHPSMMLLLFFFLQSPGVFTQQVGLSWVFSLVSSWSLTSFLPLSAQFQSTGYGGTSSENIFQSFVCPLNLSTYLAYVFLEAASWFTFISEILMYSQHSVSICDPSDHHLNIFMWCNRHSRVTALDPGKTINKKYV